MPSITIVIAEDQAIVRDGLETILNLDPELQVVATADNGLTAVSWSKNIVHKLSCWISKCLS